MKTLVIDDAIQSFILEHQLEVLRRGRVLVYLGIDDGVVDFGIYVPYSTSPESTRALQLISMRSIGLDRLEAGDYTELLYWMENV